MSTESNFAPGHPGIPPRWTSSAKSGVGTSLSSKSRVWFTLSHGILKFTTHVSTKPVSAIRNYWSAMGRISFRKKSVTQNLM